MKKGPSTLKANLLQTFCCLSRVKYHYYYFRCFISDLVHYLQDGHEKLPIVSISVTGAAEAGK